MPGDTLRVNNRAESQYTYDAIVIGSGISGGGRAKELTEKGLRTIVLERGRNFEHIKDYKSAQKDPWDFPHRGVLHRNNGRSDRSFPGAGVLPKPSWIIGPMNRIVLTRK